MYTQDQIDALTEAIATGALKVKYADKEVEYRTLEEMINLLNVMNIAVNGKPTIQQRRTMGIFRSTLNGCWPWGWR